MISKLFTVKQKEILQDIISREKNIPKNKVTNDMIYSFINKWMIDNQCSWNTALTELITNK